MRPQRNSSKHVDYAAIESTPPAVRRLVKDDFFSVDTPSPSPIHKRKVPRATTPDETLNKRKRQIYESPEPKKSKKSTKDKKEETKSKDDKGKENQRENQKQVYDSPEPKKSKRATKEKNEEVKQSKEAKRPESPEPKSKRAPKEKKDKKDEEAMVIDKPEKKAKETKETKQKQKGKEAEADKPAIQPLQPHLDSPVLIPAPKQSKATEKPKPSTSTALILSPLAAVPPKAHIPLAQQRRPLQDPIIAMSNIIGDEIKTASAKMCSLESEMVLARTTKEFMKTQDHRYDSLRTKFDELKQTIPKKKNTESSINEECKELLVQAKELMKDLENDQSVVRKKIKAQAKAVDQKTAEMEEEKKILDKEKQRVAQEGREIDIEKRRMERNEIEKERQDTARERFVNREEKKELDAHKIRLEEETRELARKKKQQEDERSEWEREKRRMVEEYTKEQRRFEAWQREIETEKRRVDEQRFRWDEEKRNMNKHQEEAVSSMKWQLDQEKQVARKGREDNEQLAHKLEAAGHMWAQHQQKMEGQIESMVKLVQTSKENDHTFKFLTMITGLTVTSLSPNKYQCVCKNETNSREVVFEVTIRDSDVEYTPIAIVGEPMPECVKESIFFQSEDWPIFLCKIIASVFRP